MSLHEAASSGDLNALKSLLAEHPNDINNRNANWETPLYCACAAGYLDAARVLLEAGARVDSKAKKRFTPLHAAAKHGHLDVVKELVSRGARLDRETIRNMTPCLVAIRYSQTKCAEFLLSHDVGVMSKDMFQRTCLHWAVKTDQREIFEVLVSKGADLSVTDKFKKTPVMQAAKSDRPELLARLLELGADRTSEDKLLRRPIHVAALNGHCRCLEVLHDTGTVPLDSWNNQYQRMTPLMFAASNGQLEAASFLLERGADPNRLNAYCQTALCLLVTKRPRDYHARPHRWCKMALTLLRGNTDVNVVGGGYLSWHDDDHAQNNALEIGFQKGYDDVTKVLARAGSHVRTIRKLFSMQPEELPEFARKNIQLLDWLRSFYGSPRTLKELSRSAVLRQIPARFFSKNLRALDLPHGIRPYLLFGDIEDLEEAGGSNSKENDDDDSNTEEEMEPSVFDSDLYGDSELLDSDEDTPANRTPSYQSLL